ncbi:uncharacterized protein J3R85_006075 [Psidium guajava]|nr:uncharacterized protein J3R85_006075 [Psidium guajava]
MRGAVSQRRSSQSASSSSSTSMSLWNLSTLIGCC